MNSNASHPLPRANTGSSVKNWVSNTLVFLVQMERRIDHWIRPPFDFLFRDLTARVVRALINSKRKDEGLKIAEEKPLPDEEQFVNSVISSFEKQMAAPLETRRIRARREHQDTGGPARRVYCSRKSAPAVPEGHLCPAADIPCMGAILGPRSLCDA